MNLGSNNNSSVRTFFNANVQSHPSHWVGTNIPSVDKFLGKRSTTSIKSAFKWVNPWH